MKIKMHLPFWLAGVIIVMLALSVYSLINYRERLEISLRLQVQSNMEKATQQSCLLFDNMISSYFTQLDTLTTFCATNAENEPEQVARLIACSNDGNQYLQLGLANADGILYSGDGVIRDISNTDYFRRSLRGERVVSDVYRSGQTGDDAIVLAEPIVRHGEIIGMACARYDVEMFTQLLANSQFDGYGATLVMQRSGKMVSSYAGMENFPTFYDALEQMDFSGADTLDSLRRRINSGESGFVTYSKDGMARYLYFAPTGHHDYVMLSLVMAEPMDEQLRDVSRRAYELVLKNVIIYCVILLCCWGIAIAVKEIIRYNQRDPLTQVYNKSGTRAMVEQLLRHQRDGRHACLFVDLDNFKSVNDCYGHDAGDKLLQIVTTILLDSFRKTDIIGRFGGDEFIVWMNGTTIENAEKKAKSLCEKLRNINGIGVSASVGIAAFPDHGKSYGDILHRADKALYMAKKRGKNTYCVFTTDEQKDLQK